MLKLKEGTNAREGNHEHGGHIDVPKEELEK